MQGMYYTDWTVLMAGTTLSLIPIITAFLLAQDLFVKGVMLSAHQRIVAIGESPSWIHCTRTPFPCRVSNSTSDSFFAPRVETIRKLHAALPVAALNDLLPDTEPTTHEQLRHRRGACQTGSAAAWCSRTATCTSGWRRCRSQLIPAGMRRSRPGRTRPSRHGKAQQPDGYLEHLLSVGGTGPALTNLQDNHELYCAGHMIEAGQRHTKSRPAADRFEHWLRFADLIDRTFGPEEGQAQRLSGPRGHRDGLGQAVPADGRSPVSQACQVLHRPARPVPALLRERRTPQV